jgi:uncharacterized surface protein with fasciclin (FAS1) repeats
MLILHQFLQEAGLAEVLKDDDAMVTVLAPKNSAFDALDDAAFEALISNPTELAKVLSLKTHFEMPSLYLLDLSCSVLSTT